jgi:hypothetical protein
MQDDFFSAAHSFHKLCFESIAMAYLNGAGARPAILHHKDTPALATAEQRVGGYFEHIVSFPRNDANVHSIAVIAGLMI